MQRNRRDHRGRSGAWDLLALPAIFCFDRLYEITLGRCACFAVVAEFFSQRSFQSGIINRRGWIGAEIIAK